MKKERRVVPPFFLCLMCHDSIHLNFFCSVWCHMLPTNKQHVKKYLVQKSRKFLIWVKKEQKKQLFNGIYSFVWYYVVFAIILVSGMKNSRINNFHGTYLHVWIIFCIFEMQCYGSRKKDRFNHPIRAVFFKCCTYVAQITKRKRTKSLIIRDLALLYSGATSTTTV